MRKLFSLGLALLVPVTSLAGQTAAPDPVQVKPPTVRRAAPPPSQTATAESLEQRGDQLKAEKSFLDALDYYRAALVKKPENALLYNKACITEILMQRFKEASRDCARSIRSDRQYADAYNNLGVVYYEEKKPGKAIKQYEKAIQLRSDSASYYSNLGAAYFAKKEFQKSVLAYNKALELDPEVLERTSRNGVTAQLPSPDDRAHFDYEIAKLYAKMGLSDQCLSHLRKAMEEGYKGINNVYKDAEFAGLRKDPRFATLMAARPTAIPE
jgi:tetratricopeptide (TPR) repeat protein